MRIFRLANRKSVRAQALLVAVLYLFLSTVGMLTHSHAGPEGDHGLVAMASTTAHGALRHAALFQGHVSTLKDCPFCDWQANSVSAALPPFHILYTAAAPEAPVGRTGGIHTAFLARFSSRAPPCA
ncbi:MAG TPA: hypothetical protein VFA07_02225 [Chthonomonadaceae bacterium]|nr:hypothetical protein [Chthonomonadaceae bacterium]